MGKRMINRIIWRLPVGALILIAIFLFVTPSILPAQDIIEDIELLTERAVEAPEIGLEGLTMETRVCLGNLVRQGCYFPVKVTLENNGPSRRGELRIVSEDVTHPFTATFMAECDIPTNSRKSYYIYPYILNQDSSPALYIQYVEKSLPLATDVIELDFLDDDEKLWIEVADEGADFVFLSGLALPDGSSFSDISVFATEERASRPFFGGGYSPGGVPTVSNIRYRPVTPAMVWVRPQNLPDRVEGYEGVSGIIMNTRRWDVLSVVQRKALAEYVISGGAIVMWLAEDEKRYQGSFLTGAFDESGVSGPYALSEPTVRTTLSALRTIPGFSENRSIIGDFPCTYATDSSARTLFSEDGVPILQHITFGRGDILLSGLDLKALKSTSSPVGLSFYANFMVGYLMSLDDRAQPIVKVNPELTAGGYRGGPRGAAVNPYVERSVYRFLHEMNNALQSDKLTALPSLAAIAYFLILYILVVGPINYYILLKMRHREWLWYTIPVIVTCFIILTYTWAMQTKGNRLTLTRVNILDVYPTEDVGWQSSYFSLFSPAARRYKVEVEGSNLIRGMQTPSLGMAFGDMGQQSQGDVLTLVHYGRDGSAFVDGAYIKIWSEEHFESSGAVYNSGSIEVENVTLRDHQLVGRLNVDLDYGISNPFIFYYLHGGFAGAKIEAEDNILQNESTVFGINLDNTAAMLPGGVTAGPIDTARGQLLRDNALKILRSRPFRNSGEDEIILAGWLSSEPPMPLVNPRVRSVIEETLVLIHIPLHVEVGVAPIEGARGRILGMQASKMEITDGGNLLLTDGILLYALTFPSHASSISMPDSLRINIATDTEETAPIFFSIYNHSSETWDTIGEAGQTLTTIMLRIGNLGRYLGPDGRTLLMRIEGDAEVPGDVIALGGVSVNAAT